MRMYLNYRAQDWLFVQSYKFLIDGKKVELAVPVETKVGEGNVYEWRDVPAKDFEINLLRLIANSKETILRYSGRQTYDDLKITKSEKAALKLVLSTYDKAHPL